ncbi:kinase-like domain-containing protein [Tribonema minus]|uniref:Kinase-like domain-containing protein n=1 Tax=Tribonema minus TaxID=303371 RepID=A0A835YKW2_9STRA|nr:kinase-like domain-containing protein [Tribonema minus]
MWCLGPTIGRGSFGEVHMGLNQITGELMAIKVCALPLCVAHSLRQPGAHACAKQHSLPREVFIMSQLQHRNTVRYLGAESDDDKVYIFQQWIPGGSISALLARFGPLSEHVTRLYARQALRGLAYLHANGIVHRDLKGDNLLIDGEGTIKIADFGTSARVPDGAAAAEMLGTPYFMAPEMLLRCDHGLPVDIWGFACTVLQMLTNRRPWHSCRVTSLPALLSVMQAALQRMPPLPPDMSPVMRAVLVNCFRWDPAERPTSRQLLRSLRDCQAPGIGHRAAAGDERLRSPRRALDSGSSSDGGSGSGSGSASASGGGGSGSGNGCSSVSCGRSRSSSTDSESDKDDPNKHVSSRDGGGEALVFNVVVAGVALTLAILAQQAAGLIL